MKKLEVKKLSQIFSGVFASEGAGVNIYRVMGTHLLADHDPFLMMDEFRSDDPSDYLAGFPSHPHRGFETITYMLAGSFEHKDNFGHQDTLNDGEVQWMTTGRGIVHSEMPKQKDGLVWGFQIWLNLPSKTKMQKPSYQNLTKDKIPVYHLENDIVVKSIAGNLPELKGAIQKPDTDPIILDISLPKGTKWSLSLPETHRFLLYSIENNILIDQDLLPDRRIGVLSSGNSVIFETTDHSAKILLLGGIPIEEPVVKHGPFVMNSVEEIRQAIEDYQMGHFDS